MPVVVWLVAVLRSADVRAIDLAKGDDKALKRWWNGRSARNNKIPPRRFGNLSYACSGPGVSMFVLFKSYLMRRNVSYKILQWWLQLWISSQPRTLSQKANYTHLSISSDLWCIYECENNYDVALRALQVPSTCSFIMKNEFDMERDKIPCCTRFFPHLFLRITRDIISWDDSYITISQVWNVFSWNARSKFRDLLWLPTPHMVSRRKKWRLEYFHTVYRSPADFSSPNHRYLELKSFRSYRAYSDGLPIIEFRRPSLSWFLLPPCGEVGLPGIFRTAGMRCLPTGRRNRLPYQIACMADSTFIRLPLCRKLGHCVACVIDITRGNDV